MKKMWLSNWLQRNESWGLNQKWVTFKQYEWKSNAGLLKEPDEYLPFQLGIKDLNTRWKPDESESIVRIKGGEMMWDIKWDTKTKTEAKWK